jgi:NADH:ubiquinone oxidoreductase subunit C
MKIQVIKQIFKSLIGIIISHTAIKSIFLIQISSELQLLAWFLRDFSLQRFKLLIDVTAMDLLKTTGKLYLIYIFLSVHSRQRIIVKMPILDSMTPTVMSLNDVFYNANWLEREVFDMFGVIFVMHPDLRRILTDYGFNYHPLLKTYPVTGFFESCYSYKKKRVIMQNLQLTQQLRTFEFTNNNIPVKLKHNI